MRPVWPWSAVDARVRPPEPAVERTVMNLRKASVRAAAILMMATSVTSIPVEASALSCAPASDLSFKVMIRKHTTGSSTFDRLVLGKVVSIKDVDPGRGGDKIARLAVAASPVGWAPLVTRVPFWVPEPAPPGEPQVGDDAGINYQRNGWYAVIAHRTKSGLFRDDSWCGNSHRVSRDHFWRLVRYDRKH